MLFFPISVMNKLHKGIKGSEFLVLSGGSHAAIIEQPETINYRIDRFLQKHQGDDLPHQQKTAPFGIESSCSLRVMRLGRYVLICISTL